SLYVRQCHSNSDTLFPLLVSSAASEGHRTMRNSFSCSPPCGGGDMCLCLYCVPDHIHTRASTRQNNSASSLSGAHQHTHFHACLWCSEHHGSFLRKLENGQTEPCLRSLKPLRTDSGLRFRD